MQRFGGLTITTPSEREIVLVRAFQAPRDLVIRDRVLRSPMADGVNAGYLKLEELLSALKRSA